MKIIINQRRCDLHFDLSSFLLLISIFRRSNILKFYFFFFIEWSTFYSLKAFVNVFSSLFLAYVLFSFDERSFVVLKRILSLQVYKSCFFLLLISSLSLLSPVNNFFLISIDSFFLFFFISDRDLSNSHGWLKIYFKMQSTSDAVILSSGLMTNIFDNKCVTSL